MPANDYYADAAPAEAAPEPEMPEQPEDAGEASTAEVPKAILGGQELKPGDEVTLEVVQVMENSVLLKYASGEEEEPEPEETPSAPSTPEEQSAPAGDMASMME